MRHNWGKEELVTVEEMDTLLFEGIGGLGVAPDLRTLERDVRFLLEYSKIDVAYFDSDKNPKGITDLCEELANHECALRYDSQTGRLQRLARSAKLHVHAEGFALQEEVRRYDNNKEVRTEEEFAFSETMLLFRTMNHIAPGMREGFRETILGVDQIVNLLGDEKYSEQPEEAAQRALLEEPSIYVADRTRFDVKALAHLNRDISDPRILRESRVYFRIQSRVATYHVLLLLAFIAMHRRMGFWYRDKKVRIYCGWNEIRDHIARDRSLALRAG